MHRPKNSGALRSKLGVATVVAMTAIGGLAVGGAAPANAGVAGGAGGKVLVKEVRTASGVLDVYKLTGVQPYSDHGCSNAPDMQVCMYIDGSGLYVNIAENRTNFYNAGTVNMRITGPSVWTETGNFYESGGWYSFDWRAYRNVVGGSYCAVSFTYSDAGSNCQPVHS